MKRSTRALLLAGGLGSAALLLALWPEGGQERGSLAPSGSGEEEPAASPQPGDSVEAAPRTSPTPGGVSVGRPAAIAVVAGAVHYECGDAPGDLRVTAVPLGGSSTEGPRGIAVLEGSYRLELPRGCYRLECRPGDAARSERWMSTDPVVCVEPGDVLAQDLIVGTRISMGVRYRAASGKWLERVGGVEISCREFYGAELTCRASAADSYGASSYAAEPLFHPGESGQRQRVAGVLSLPCAGPWEVTVHWGEAEVWSVSLPAAPAILDIVLPDGVLAPHAAVVRGRLPQFANPGEAQELHWGVYLSSDPALRARLLCQPDERGEFEFEDVPPGEYVLVAAAPQMAMLRIPLRLRSGEVVDMGQLDMAGSGNLFAYLVGPEGEPILCAYWVGSAETGGACVPLGDFGPLTTDAQPKGGRLNVWGLPPGRYLLGVGGNCAYAVNPSSVTVAGSGVTSQVVHIGRGTPVTLTTYRDQKGEHLHVAESDGLVIWCQPKPESGEEFQFGLRPGRYTISHGLASSTFELGGEPRSFLVGDVGTIEAAPFRGESSDE